MGAQAAACCREVLGAQDNDSRSSASCSKARIVVSTPTGSTSTSPRCSIGIHRAKAPSRSIGLHRVAHGTASLPEGSLTAGDSEEQIADNGDSAEYGDGATDGTGERAPTGTGDDLGQLLRRRSTREGMCARQMLKDLAKNTSDSLEKYEDAGENHAMLGSPRTEQTEEETQEVAKTTRDNSCETFEDGSRSCATAERTASMSSVQTEEDVGASPLFPMPSDLDESPDRPKPPRRGVSHDFFWHPEQTVIILDWDDTLFPTTWIDYDMQLPLDRPPPKRDDILQPLQLVISRAQDFTKCACKLSAHVIIVTLAKSPWVQNCMRNFAPALAKTLARLKIPIVYARKYEKRGGSDSKYDKKEFGSNEELMAYWTGIKAAAIHAECAKCYSQYKGQTWKNVISIGDSYFERDGTREVVKRWCEANARTAYQLPRTKTVKFLDDPTCDEVADQLKLLIAWLPVLVRKDGAFNLDLDSAGAEEDITGLHQLISSSMGLSGDAAAECPEAALIDGHLWKLVVGGDPLEEASWFRRRMWLSKSGRLWYESLKWVKWAQLFPEVLAGHLVASYALDGVETVAKINGTATFSLRIQTSSPGDQKHRESSFSTEATEVWLSYDRGLRTTFLAAESEQIRDDWITAISSFSREKKTG